MSIKSKVTVALAALTLATSLTIPTSGAQAHGRGWGFGAALVGGAIVGGAIASEAAYGSYVEGYRRCRWERQYDAYGFYVGTARVCRVY